jgi:hypothetical protein
MKRKEILVLILISMMLTLMVGCALSFTLVLSSATEITSYRFEATINPVLSSDVEGTINSYNHTVSLTVPYDTPLTSLVATFTLSSGAAAKIGTAPQVSGTTANDFTHSLTYTVTAEDGSTQDWVVSVTIANSVRYVATDGDDTNDGSEEHPLSGSGTITIGGSGEENTICGNYKTGDEPSLDQQIRDDSGSLHLAYEGTNFISAYCTP